jgi:hypothetical protein
MRSARGSFLRTDYRHVESRRRFLAIGNSGGAAAHRDIDIFDLVALA